MQLFQPELRFGDDLSVLYHEVCIGAMDTDAVILIHDRGDPVFSLSDSGFRKHCAFAAENCKHLVSGHTGFYGAELLECNRCSCGGSCLPIRPAGRLLCQLIDRIFGCSKAPGGRKEAKVNAGYQKQNRKEHHQKPGKQDVGMMPCFCTAPRTLKKVCRVDFSAIFSLYLLDLFRHTIPSL